MLQITGKDYNANYNEGVIKTLVRKYCRFHASLENHYLNKTKS